MVFDPERDDDPGNRPFYRRLLAVGLIAAAASAALWPSVSGFSAGPDHDRGCVAITDGFHADKSGPSAAEVAAINAAFPAPPSRQQQHDPEALARFRSRWQAANARPDVQRANAYADWVDGPGACVHESRHRLIVSGVGLTGLAVLVGGVSIFRRTRPHARRSRASAAPA